MGPYEKLYHRGSLVDNNGRVSALCFAKPRPIDLSKAMWTNRDEAVTCPKCLKLIEDRAAPRCEADHVQRSLLVGWTQEPPFDPDSLVRVELHDSALTIGPEITR